TATSPAPASPVIQAKWCERCLAAPRGITSNGAGTGEVGGAGDCSGACARAGRAPPGAAIASIARSRAPIRRRMGWTSRLGRELVDERREPGLLSARGLALDHALRGGPVEDRDGVLERGLRGHPCRGTSDRLDGIAHARGGGDVPLAPQLVRTDALGRGLVMRHEVPP